MIGSRLNRAYFLTLNPQPSTLNPQPATLLTQSGVQGNPGKNILGFQDRGVVSLERQFNAVNFVFYVKRADTSYMRKLCTSRLSFYIDDSHG